jgi:hypothetical protein
MYNMQVDRSECIFVEFDKDTAHIVTTQLLLCGVLAQKTIEHLLEHLLGSFPADSIISDPGHQILTVLLVPFPDTVATDDNKVIIFTNFNSFDIRMPRDRLSVIFQVRVLLVVEISQTSGKIQMVINATAFHLCP